ncbi:hypothetical protein SK128_012330 [Halocaridina rubra]|uniref:Uncharacterized protein n=1 Tax=Halocaridina rubra TaxID=373956 RepID=A0AAN8WMQ6_HALRR
MNLEWLHKYEEPAVQRGSLLALVEDHPPVKKMVDFADRVASKLSQNYEKVTVRSETMTEVLKEWSEKRVNSIPPYEEEEEGREKDLAEPIVGNEKETEEQLQCGCYDEADQVKPDPLRKALQAKIALEKLKRKTKTQKEQFLETVKMCQGKAVEGNGSETEAAKGSHQNDDERDQGKREENVEKEQTEKEINEGKENKNENPNSKVERKVATFKKLVPINPVIRRKQMKIQRRNPRSYAPVI